MEEENNHQIVELLARPPVIKAFQWDGTLEGASALKSFIAEMSEFRLHDLIKFEARFDDDSSPLVYIEFPKGYITRDYAEKMRPDDWLVMGPGGMRDILPTEALDRLYIRKKTDA